MGNSPREKPHGVGKSSFGLIDPDIVLGELGLKRGMTLLDLCCGRGEYSVAVSRIIGGEGRVYAVDLWEEGISSLLKEVSARNIKNAQTGGNMLVCGAAFPGQTSGFVSHPSKFWKKHTSTDSLKPL